MLKATWEGHEWVAVRHEVPVSSRALGRCSALCQVLIKQRGRAKTVSGTRSTGQAHCWCSAARTCSHHARFDLNGWPCAAGHQRNGCPEHPGFSRPLHQKLLRIQVRAALLHPRCCSQHVESRCSSASAHVTQLGHDRQSASDPSCGTGQLPIKRLGC